MGSRLLMHACGASPPLARSGGAGAVSVRPGPCVWSEEAFLLAVLWCDRPLILRVSVVDNDVPCSISRRALQWLGAVIDLGKIEMRSSQLSGQKKVHEMTMGHVVVQLMDLDAASPDLRPVSAFNDLVNDVDN